MRPFCPAPPGRPAPSTTPRRPPPRALSPRRSRRRGDGDSASLLDGARYNSGQGVLTQWDAQQFSKTRRDGAVDSVRLSVGSPTLIPGLGPRELAGERFTPDAFDVTVTRTLPQALRFAAGDFNIDFTPHAGVGFGNAGGSAEAGRRGPGRPES